MPKTVKRPTRRKTKPKPRLTAKYRAALRALVTLYERADMPSEKLYDALASLGLKWRAKYGRWQ